MHQDPQPARFVQLEQSSRTMVPLIGACASYVNWALLQLQRELLLAWNASLGTFQIQGGALHARHALQAHSLLLMGAGCVSLAAQDFTLQLQVFQNVQVAHQEPILPFNIPLYHVCSVLGERTPCRLRHPSWGIAQGARLALILSCTGVQLQMHACNVPLAHTLRWKGHLHGILVKSVQLDIFQRSWGLFQTALAWHAQQGLHPPMRGPILALFVSLVHWGHLLQRMEASSASCADQDMLLNYFLLEFC